MILLINYDLKKPGQDYTALYNAIKAAPSWWHYLESTWIIRTNETPQVWSERLRRTMDVNDHILVVDITSRPRWGWLPQKAWEWLRENERL